MSSGTISWLLRQSLIVLLLSLIGVPMRTLRYSMWHCLGTWVRQLFDMRDRLLGSSSDLPPVVELLEVQSRRC